MKRLLVGTVPPKSEDIICRYSPTKKISEEVIGRNSSTKKIVKKLLVGTVPPKKWGRGYWSELPHIKIVKRLLVGIAPPKKLVKRLLV